MARSSRPDPDSNYLSKYILDFNKRELDKFFHPEKYPQTILTVAALGVVLFFVVAWMAPFKNGLFNTQYPKQGASADDQKTTQNVSITGPLTVKKGDRLTVMVNLRTDKKTAQEFAAEIIYPEDYLTVVSSKAVEEKEVGENKKLVVQKGRIMISDSFSSGLQTNGAAQELAAVTFTAKTAGRVNLSFDDGQTELKDAAGQIIPLTKTNYSVVITD